MIKVFIANAINAYLQEIKKESLYVYLALCEDGFFFYNKE